MALLNQRVVGIVGVVLAAGAALAQDAVKTLPDSYRLELENEHVRVVRVHYEPHAKLPAHDHPHAATAYVYLNDGGPVLFKHIGLEYGEIERPATVAGGLRLARPVEEVHEVENPNDVPSDFLRVEFKRLSAAASMMRGRFVPEAHAVEENFTKALFENEGLRVTRRACAPTKACDLSPADAPVLLVALGAGTLTTPKENVVLVPGRSEWLAVGSQRIVENAGKQPAEFLTFAFKAALPAPKEN